MLNASFVSVIMQSDSTQKGHYGSGAELVGAMAVLSHQEPASKKITDGLKCKV
jgi:hypothetical protein